MKHLRISDTLTLPATAVTETFALLAIRGAGKTNAARVMAEEMFAARAPFVAVDPVGSWWGLRAGRDGKPGGIPIPVFGGKHGDVPLERSGGVLVADIVVDQRLSCVLDLSGFDSEAAKKAFLLDFARRLYARNTEPLHLFLEEADDFIPQKPQRDELQLVRAWENIVRRGRSRGLGMTLVTQRSAVIAKNVLTQVGTLIAMRSTSPQDRAAIEAWVKYHGEKEDILASLSSLQSGEAWVWSPNFLGKTERIRFRLSTTFDSGATPKLGAAAGKDAATLADVDIGALQKRMAATIERAKADDPKELRAEIARLNRELAAKPAPPAAKVERVEVLAVKDAQLKRLEALAEKARIAIDTYVSAARSIQDVVARATHDRRPAPINRSPQSSRPVARVVPRTEKPARSVSQPAAGDPISGPEQRILDAIAWLEATNGRAEQDQTAVAFVAGYTVGGGAFNNPRGKLNTRGLVEYRSGSLALTEAGRALAVVVDAPLSNEDLQARVIDRLPGPEGKILRVLIEAYPEALSNEDLARRAGYEPGGGAFNNPRGRLRSLGLIDYPSKGHAVALPVLFMEAKA